MRVVLDFPGYVIAYADHVVMNRRKARTNPSSVTYAGRDGKQETQVLMEPPLSRTAVLQKIIELGFAQFLVEYSTEQQLATLKGWRSQGAQ